MHAKRIVHIKFLDLIILTLFGPIYKHYSVQCTNIIRSNVQILYGPMYKYYLVQCTNIIWSNAQILFGPTYKYYLVQCTNILLSTTFSYITI